MKSEMATCLSLRTGHIRANLWISIALCLFILGQYQPAQAGKYLLHKTAEVAVDTTTGLIWERCPLGQKIYKDVRDFCADETDREKRDLIPTTIFQMATCCGPDATEGFPTNMRGDWRLPTAREWLGFFECSKGTEKVVNLGDGLHPVGHECKEWPFNRIHDSVTFPFYKGRYDFWTSTPVKSQTGQGMSQWSIFFESGGLFPLEVSSGKKAAVLMVRPSGMRTAKEFADAGFTRTIETAAEQEVNNRKRMEQVLAERAVEKERQAAADSANAAQKRQGVLNGILNGGPQFIYLQAGKAERSGGLQTQGEYFSAKELYEALIDRYPGSPFAAKANDQLLAIDREYKARTMLEDDRYAQGRRAYEACRIEVDSCNQRTNYKGNCWRDCDKLR